MKIITERVRLAWMSRRSSQSLLLPAAFQLFTLSLGVLNVYYWPSEPVIAGGGRHLFAFTLALAAAFVIPPLVWQPYGSRIRLTAVISVQYSLATVLLCLTGAVNSPFLLYSFTPVLTSALLLQRHITYSVAGLTVLSAVASLFIYPFYSGVTAQFSLSRISLYAVAISLTASLPYLINANLKQNMEEEHTRSERLRLSREIHDGIAQTLHSLCWQVQILQHREAIGARQEKSDLDKLESLADKARRDILESLQVLRNVDDSGDNTSLVSLLKRSLESFKQEQHINAHFRSDEPGYGLDSRTRLEVSRVFQEALSNVRRHSGARNLWVDMRKSRDRVALVISDDGHGFDVTASRDGHLSARGHHGLAVMEERIRSIRGEIHIMSCPDKGTEIRVEFPHGGQVPEEIAK